MRIVRYNYLIRATLHFDFALCYLTLLLGFVLIISHSHISTYDEMTYHHNSHKIR